LTESEIQRARRHARFRCAEATRHDPDVRGRCRWCGRLGVDSAYPAPRPTGVRTNLDLAYSYYYDPDFGSDRLDVY